MPTLFRSSKQVIWCVVFCVQRWKVTLKHLRWKTTAKNSIGNKLECAQLGFDDDTYSTHDLSGADTQHAQHWQVISGQLGHPGGVGGNEKMRDEMSWWPMNEPPGLWLKEMWTLVPECHSLTDLQGKHSLFPLGAISHTDAAVVGHPGQVVSAGGEGDAMHPPTAVFLLQQNLSERHLGPPDCGSGLFLNVLDVSWENPVKAQPHCFTFLLRVPQPTGIYCKLDFVVFVYKQLAWDWGPRVCCSHQKCSLKGAPPWISSLCSCPSAH